MQLKLSNAESRQRRILAVHDISCVGRCSLTVALPVLSAMGFETSILPYEDCCTIFVAKHPVTKPSLDIIKRHEHNLDEVIDGLMEEALKTKELIIVHK